MAAGRTLTVQAAAARLHVDRSRIEALITSGALPAKKAGNQWLISARHADLYANTRRDRGRPIQPGSAWDLILRPTDLFIGQEVDRIDGHRRRLRARASHRSVYVHPGLLAEVVAGPDIRLGGRDAAIEAGAPLDPDDTHDVYLPATLAEEWLRGFGARAEADDPNVWLHVVPDDVWPNLGDERHLGLFVAWLDLADRLDRGADLVFDRLAGGRPLA